MKKNIFVSSVVIILSLILPMPPKEQSVVTQEQVVVHAEPVTEYLYKDSSITNNKLINTTIKVSESNKIEETNTTVTYNDIPLEPEYQDLVREMITLFDIDTDEYFFYGMMWEESRFNHTAVSPVGAKGIIQLMPDTWDEVIHQVCVKYPQLIARMTNDPFDKTTNIICGMYYMRWMQDYFGYDSMNKYSHKLLTAYNRGIGIVDKYYENTGSYASRYSEDILRVADTIRTTHCIAE